jgi:glycosyltransferase involved in cell wall biosynthesis
MNARVPTLLGTAGTPSGRVTVIGHVSGTRERANGQVIRTRLTIAELSEALGSNLQVVDTGIDPLRRPREFARLAGALLTSDHIIHMPGATGLAQLTPLLTAARRIRPMSLHLCAIGGWLPAYLSRRPGLVEHLKTYATVFVQTRRAARELTSLGLDNVTHMPNFRRFELARQTPSAISGRLRLVFMSRIIPDKGVATAIEAMRLLEAKAPRGTTVGLDIWGPVEGGDGPWFEATMRGAPPSVVYRGPAHPDRVHEILRGYDVMVFPTQYRGEGFPGAVLDAMIAGLPVIASRWIDMEEWVEDGVSGILVPPGDAAALCDRCVWCATHPHDVQRMAVAAWTRAENYHADRVMPILLRVLGFADGRRLADAADGSLR